MRKGDCCVAWLNFGGKVIQHITHLNGQTMQTLLGLHTCMLLRTSYSYIADVYRAGRESDYTECSIECAVLPWILKISPNK